MKVLAAITILVITAPTLAQEKISSESTDPARQVVELSDEQMDGVVAAGCWICWDAGFVLLDVNERVITSDPGAGLVKGG